MSATTPRPLERRLFLASGLVTLLGALLLWGSRGSPVSVVDVVRPVAFCLTLGVLHLYWRATGFRGSERLSGATAFLAAFGMLAQARLSTGGGGAGDWALPIGAAALLVVSLGCRGKRVDGLERWGPLCGLAGLTLVTALLVGGQRFRGAVFGPGGMTPTELLKLLVVCFVAAHLANRHRALDKVGAGVLPVRTLVPLAIYWVLLMALLVLQRDLGMFILLSGALLTMLYVQTKRLSYLVYAGAAAGGLGWAAFHFLGHSQRRLLAWLDPFADPTGAGWQVLQGLSALYTGGFWGVGFGSGEPHRIPIAASDFVYAVIGEEFGFLGCLLLVGCYLVWFSEGFRIAFASRTPFRRLLAAGIVGGLAIQTLLNIGGVTKALPLTGIPLPLLSHGGSSVVITLTGIGLLLAISDDLPGSGKRPSKKKKPGAPRKKRPSSGR